MNKLILFSTLCAGLLQSAESHAQSDASFPYGAEWSGNRYGPNNPWFSVGSSVGVQLLRFSNEEYLDTATTTNWSIETRYHTSPTLAFVVGLVGDRATQKGGSSVSTTYTGSSKVAGDRYLKSGDTISVNYNYEARAGHSGMVLGADVGLMEREYWHVQVGPRVGFVRYKSDLTFSIDSEGISDDQISGDLGGGTGAFIDPMFGMSLRVGAFPTPAVEVGIDLHGAAIIGLGDSIPDGLYESGLSTVPGAALYTTVHL
jgi:hypothetical protein